MSKKKRESDFTFRRIQPANDQFTIAIQLQPYVHLYGDS